MDIKAIVFWVTLGILVVGLLAGLLIGLARGLKRSALHLLFFVASMVLAFFIAKPITKAVLGINITANGSTQSIGSLITSLIEDQFNLSNLTTAQDFINNLPNAILSPVLFLVLAYLCYGVFEIIYLIVARISFGKKKEDFKTHKPYRAYGAVIGLCEGFLVLFLTFAPLSSLTQTYQEILTASNQTSTVAAAADNTNLQKTVGESLTEFMPSKVNDAILAFNNSVLGKMAGAGGVDNLLFDGLSNFKVDGEKIKFREELKSVTKSYDQVVITINTIQLKQFDKLDFEALKTTLEKFMDQGIFKKVVSDTVYQGITKFDQIKKDFGLTNLPALATDLIDDLQTSFSAEDFSTHEYLKHDILKVVDIVESLYKNNFLGELLGANAESTSSTIDLESLLNYLKEVDEHSEDFANALTNLFDLNLVKDTFDTLGDYLSEVFAKAFNNEKLGLNLNYADKDSLISSLTTAINKLVNIKIDISKISTDFIASLPTSDTASSLTSVGEAFDAVRNLSVLVLPIEEGKRDEVVYVFDEILKGVDIDLLGDMTSYTDLFQLIAPAVEKVQALNILDKDVTFETIFDSLLNEIRTKESNEEVLSDILLPFYQLNNTYISKTNSQTFKTLVFDKTIDLLTTSVGDLIDFNAVKTKAKEGEADYNKQEAIEIWEEELAYLEDVLDALNYPASLEEGEKTYLKGLLDQTASLQDTIKRMIANNDLDDLLNPMFESVIFEGLTESIFAEIDSSVKGFTKSTVSTDLTNLKTTKASVINVIKELMSGKLDDLSTISLTEIGEILDILKVNAKNGGSYDGVFNNIFANLIWYLTGDNINSATIDGEATAIEENEDIKKYLNVDTTANFNGYYEISYAEKFAELEEVIHFAEHLSTKLEGKNLDTNENKLAYINAFSDAVTTMTASDGNSLSDEQKVTIMTNMKTLLDNKNAPLLTSEQIEQDGEYIKTIINSKAELENVKSGIFVLLGLSA